MKMLYAIVLASGLALSAGSAANAMSDDEMISMGQSMLTGALYNSLRSQGYSTDGIDKLTLGEIATLNNLLTSSESRSVVSGQVNLIFERAMAR